MAMQFWWWPMSSWLSPGAAWFIFFNAVVGAIAVMSRVQGGHAPSTRRKLVRTASTVVMESLRSISIFSFHSGVVDYSVVSPSASQLHHVQDQYYTSQEQEADEVSRVVPELRLRKLEPAPMAEENGTAPTETTAPPSAPVATAAAADASPSRSEREEEDGETISLDEAYGLARARRQSPAAAAAADTVAWAPKKRELVKVAEVKRRAYACGRGAEEVEAKAEVNARAEQFIRQFREELKLERLNSILNHTHALRRGAGTAAPR